MVDNSNILIISPTYNEIENIETFIDSILALNLNLLVIDDGSPDGTAKLIKKSCIEMDADFSHTFKDLKKILSKLLLGDIVIGSRYVKDGGSLGWDRRRKTLSKYANIFARLILNSDINDLTSGFRSFNKRALTDIDFNSITTNGYGFQIEMAFNAEKADLSVIEVPIIFEERRLGQSKMNLQITFEALILLFKLSIKRNN